jgi:hypothetical protein
VQRVGRIVAVENDLSSAEAAATGDRQQPSHFFFRHTLE